MYEGNVRPEMYWTADSFIIWARNWAQYNTLSSSWLVCLFETIYLSLVLRAASILLFEFVGSNTGLVRFY